MEIQNSFSVTDLTGYDYYRSGEMPLEKYIAQLLRLEPPTDAMKWGTKWHKYLQDMAMGLYVWNNPDVYGEYEWAIEPVELIQPDVVEMPVSGVYSVNGRNIQLRGRIDAKAGTTVIDYKTTKSPDLESYMASFQWRAYLDMVPDATLFRYDVFTMSDPQTRSIEVQDVVIEDPNEYRVITGYSFVELPHYKALHDDVTRKVAEFDNFLVSLAEAGKIELMPDGSGIFRQRIRNG